MYVQLKKQKIIKDNTVEMKQIPTFYLDASGVIKKCKFSKYIFIPLKITTCVKYI